MDNKIPYKAIHGDCFFFFFWIGRWLWTIIYNVYYLFFFVTRPFLLRGVLIMPH